MGGVGSYVREEWLAGLKTALYERQAVIANDRSHVVCRAPNTSVDIPHVFFEVELIAEGERGIPAWKCGRRSFVTVWRPNLEIQCLPKAPGGVTIFLHNHPHVGIGEVVSGHVHIHAHVVAWNEPTVWVPPREQGGSRWTTNGDVGEEVLQSGPELVHHRDGVPHSVRALRDKLLVVRKYKHEVGMFRDEVIVRSVGLVA